MKTTYKSLVASALLGLALSQSAQAQIGSTVLVAGFDFNGLSSATIQSIDANYSDLFDPAGTPQDGVAAASRGTFLANGQGGSENIPFGPATGLSISNTPDLIDRQITSRSTGVTQLFGYLSGPDNALQIAQRNTLTPQTFSFRVNATEIADLSLSLWLSKNPVGNLTIDWSYKVGAGAVQGLGLTTNLSALGATYENFIIDFSSIDALDNQAEVFLIGSAVSTNTAASGLRFDNTGIYGTVVEAIPEPSTYAVILGAMCLGFVALRRRRVAA